MQWISKRSLVGTCTDRVWFAWYPVECQDNTWRWLEYLSVRSEFYLGHYSGAVRRYVSYSPLSERLQHKGRPYVELGGKKDGA